MDETSQSRFWDRFIALARKQGVPESVAPACNSIEVIHPCLCRGFPAPVKCGPRNMGRYRGAWQTARLTRRLAGDRRPVELAAMSFVIIERLVDAKAVVP